MIVKTMLTTAATLLTVSVLAAGCNMPAGTGTAGQASASPPLPFRAEDNVVPAVLDPDRPVPPPPVSSLARLQHRLGATGAGSAGTAATSVPAPAAPASEQ